MHRALSSKTAEGSALLSAATAAGHGPRARILLEEGMFESAREDGELMLWAADYGAYQLIHQRLEGNTTKPMLAIARRWTGVDVVAELRRRLGDPDAVVDRGTVSIEDYCHTERVRVTTADGRWAEVQTAHPAIVTYIEELLGLGGSRDELLARALLDPDSDSINWIEIVSAVTGRRDTEATARWAGTVLTDSDPVARRFAAEVLAGLS